MDNIYFKIIEAIENNNNEMLEQLLFKLKKQYACKEHLNLLNYIITTEKYHLISIVLNNYESTIPLSYIYNFIKKSILVKNIEMVNIIFLIFYSTTLLFSKDDIYYLIIYSIKSNNIEIVNTIIEKLNRPNLLFTDDDIYRFIKNAVSSNEIDILNKILDIFYSTNFIFENNDKYHIIAETIRTANFNIFYKILKLFYKNNNFLNYDETIIFNELIKANNKILIFFSNEDTNNRLIPYSKKIKYL
jgi:hypothetical protein